jgi:hypothetical protein
MPTTNISIKFRRAGKNAHLYSGKFTYRSAESSTDSLEISNKTVLIKTTRSSSKASPLQAHNSTFYKQIIKSLCLYYILEKKPNPLKEITLTKQNSAKVIATISIPSSQIKQIVSKTTDLLPLATIDSVKASILLSETPAGRAVLNACTHLIKSLDSSNAFERFEKLWRAFNALYKAFAKQNSDHLCHVALRDYLKQNPNHFPLSIARVAPLSAIDIRTNIRLNQMILNNCPTQAKAPAFADSITRNSDPRVMEIYRNSLPIRETFLVNAKRFTLVTTHISACIAANVACDADVLSTLCIKYMYFVRNKMAHAEKTDHGFSFIHGSSDESEIRWLTPFLEALVIDLINISDTF